MQIICITVGSKRIGINPANIVTIEWNDPKKFMKGGTAKMVDGASIVLDEQAMLNLCRADVVVEPRDVKDMYSW